jgi:gluconate 2-dehydrogenase gamma chain
MNEPGEAGISRRRALRAMAAAASTAWVSELALLAEQQAVHAHLLAVTPQGGTWTPTVLSPTQFETVGVLVEAIIPTTDTPGARAALVDRYVDGVLSTATPTIRDGFLAGLDWLDNRSATLFNTPFRLASASQQSELLSRLASDGSTEEAAGVQFFRAVKSMTITGYYTTEIGLVQELGTHMALVLPAYPGCQHPEHQ